MNPTEILRLHAYQQINYWCFRHPWRNCIYDEAEEVIRLGYDVERRVREQMDYYSRLGYPKNAGLWANGVLLRKHNDPAIVQLGEIWFEHVLRFSKRDQLSSNFVAKQVGIDYGIFEGQLTDNQFILWPGHPEGQSVPADFDEEVYEWLNPEVRQSGLSPRKHYVLHGMTKGLPYKTEKSELDRLANKYKTDKGSLYYNAHAFAAIYERHFALIKDKPLRLLELGLPRHDVQARTPGGSFNDAPSLFMWQEYFPNAQVIGFDIADFSGVPELPRCRKVQGDISNPADLLALTTEDGFDIIIDDASHPSHHQQIALSTLFPFVREGGFYIIEDLNYQPTHLELPGAGKTKQILRALCSGGLLSTPYITKSQLRYLAKNAASIEFYDSFGRCFGVPMPDALIVIQKRQDLTQ